MSRPYTGKQSTGIRKVKRPNGDIYVYERIIEYDQKIKKTKTVGNKLIGKIRAGESEISPTRPRINEKIEQVTHVTAERKSIGATDILSWVGKVSGIDDDLEHSFVDGGDAHKIESIARYWVATGGQSLPRMESWQVMHELPYEEGISEDVYGRLFEEVGVNETGVQQYFASRAARLDGKDTIAFDSTTVSTYSGNQREARYGFNKDKDGLPTIKLLTLYSVNNHEPIAFCKQPGNLADVVCIENSIKQIQCLSLSKPLVVTDNGYFSWNNITHFARKNMKFLTRIDTSPDWVREIIKESKDEFETLCAQCPFDMSVHGIRRTITKELTWHRKRFSVQGEKGDVVKMSKRLYLYVFHNRDQVLRDQIALEKEINTLKSLLESGEREFTDAAQKMISKYLVVNHRGRGAKLHVGYNEQAYKEARQNFGYFALLSNEPLDLFDCLKKYRLREKIEEMFCDYKNNVDGEKPRVWYPDSLRGRQFVQFVALGYRCFLEKKIAEVKAGLEADIQKCNLAETAYKKEHETVDKRSAEWKQFAENNGIQDLDLILMKKLNNWLRNRSLNQVLDWYECTERTTVSTPVARKRWTTEFIAQDRLFLQRLGVASE